MSYYDDDYYQEPSEFDKKVEELKASLASAVKEETREELKILREENRQLKDKVQNLQKLERDASTLKRELERKVQAAERDAQKDFRKMKFGELMAIFTEPKYKIGSERVVGEKCGNCDDRRSIHYKTPSGRDATEQCPCGIGKLHYILKEEVAVEISRNTRDRDKPYNVWYAPHMNDRNDDDYINAKWVTDPATMTFEEQVESYYALGFSSKEDAQKLADALNAKEATK